MVRAAIKRVTPFGTVLVLNVLEHTFDPIRVLDHAATLLKKGGVLVVITHAVWPVHDAPVDTWRILPAAAEWRDHVGRVVHRACNTFGRSALQPGGLSVGAVFVT